MLNLLGGKDIAKVHLLNIFGVDTCTLDCTCEQKLVTRSKLG
jgi:hypothetical protein